MKETFILLAIFEEGLDKDGFLEAKEDYCKTIIENDFSIAKCKKPSSTYKNY